MARRKLDFRASDELIEAVEKAAIAEGYDSKSDFVKSVVRDWLKRNGYLPVKR